MTQKGGQKGIYPSNAGHPLLHLSTCPVKTLN